MFYMKMKTIDNGEYVSPATRILTLNPARCIAVSAILQDMYTNGLHDEDF